MMVDSPLVVVCSYCGAAVGQLCRRADGKPRQRAHKPRIEASGYEPSPQFRRRDEEAELDAIATHMLTVGVKRLHPGHAKGVRSPGENPMAPPKKVNPARAAYRKRVAKRRAAAMAALQS